MPGAAQLILALIAAYGGAAVLPLLRDGIRGRAGVVASWCVVPIVLACPLLISPAQVGLRVASAFASGDLVFKMVTFLRLWGRQPDPVRFRRAYHRYLAPFPVLAAVYPDRRRRRSRPKHTRREWLRLAVGLAGFVIALQALRAVSDSAWLRASFARNHVVMLLLFVLGIESLSRAICGLERLAGFETTPIIRNAYRSRTVAEFWQRYNDRIHDWMYRNVFLPIGGRRAPVRSVLLTFLVSGFFHEAAFAMATSRLTGYQLAFFTIQGPAVLASGRLERLSRRGGIAGRIVAHALTILFVGGTSVLFFDGVSRIFPFVYASGPPLP